MTVSGLLPLLIFFVWLAMLPFVFGQVFAATLIKFKLEPTTALLVVIGIYMGSPINIPVKRISRRESVLADPLAVFGLSRWWPALQQVRRDTVIAGLPHPGCVGTLRNGSPPDGRLANTIRIAPCDSHQHDDLLCTKPIEGIGIAMPGLFPALLAAVTALLFVPDRAPLVAFVAGVPGPLIGADLLHLCDIEKFAIGIASLGEAGTFDGIVLSGIVAVYLA